MSQRTAPPLSQQGPVPQLSAYLRSTHGAAMLRRAGRRPRVAGLLFWSALGAVLYLLAASPDRQDLDYFVRLADAFLQGRIHLTEAPSWLNELVPAGDGRWYVVYPPFPALVLTPFVAVFGTGLHQQVVSSVLGGVSVGVAWLLFFRLTTSIRSALVLTGVFGFGTVLWYVASTGSVWYFAHVVAVLMMTSSLLLVVSGRMPLLAGLLLGCAAISRLPVALAAPAIVAILVGLDGRRLPDGLARAARTAVTFGIGMALPLGCYAAYNLVRWGTLMDSGYVLIPGVLEDPVYVEHGILSIEYVPRNLYAIFLRSWNYVNDPPFLQPSWWGLSLFLTTPLFLWLARARLSNPMVLWSVVGVALVSIPIITHGNVGFSQFGYRFSLDAQPLLFVILATVFRDGISRRATGAAILSIAVCAYGLWAIRIGFVSF